MPADSASNTAHEHEFPTAAESAPDSAPFRAVMSRFATGVTVATTCQGNRRMGITVNAFTSVSLNPPLVLICIERSSRVRDAFIESGFFAVNILASEQEELSACFASNSEDRFERFCDTASHAEVTGAPVLNESLGFVDCRIERVYDGGDHDILLGRVLALGVGEGDPLLYYRSHYIHPENDGAL
jgi:3-hydroxy-9,10-secoandrosta-1,3,5(10)-triene-9,17-dione monooxygenase reductase component